MCTGQSYPIIAVSVVESPIIVDVPRLFQPPELLKSVKTDFALFRGPRTQSGIMMMKSPVMWIIRISASTRGSFFARNVLKMTEKSVMAMVIRVPWYASKT